jgi:hypothetical protein
VSNRGTQKANRILAGGVFSLVCAGLALGNAQVAAAQEPADAQAAAPQKPALTANEIVSRMDEMNHARELALPKLEGTRHYRIEYRGVFGNREAEAVVSYNFASPDRKEFVVLSQSGSKVLFDHVIKGLLEEEKEAATSENRSRTALSPRNYDFVLDEAETAREPSRYVLSVIPKNDNKFLYRGKIWVDASDFAVAQIKAEPAKTPSFWVKKSEVRHQYEKVGDFWLPAENKTESVIRLGGRAYLSIEYKDYKLTDAAPLKRAESGRGDSTSSFGSNDAAATR